MTWQGGGRGKVEWLVHRLVVPKRPSRVRGIWRRILVWIKPALEADRWGQPVPGKTLTHKKERKKSKNWEPVKDKYNSNRFPSTILKYWKVIWTQKKRDCKGSISPIIKFIEWTLLQASVRWLRHFYSSKKKRKKEKRGRRKRTAERHFGLTFSFWLHILSYFKKKREKKKEMFLKSHHYLFGRRILKFCYILNAP